MITKELKAEIEVLVTELARVIRDTGIKEHCRISPEFREEFLKEAREMSRCFNLAGLCEFIIDILLTGIFFPLTVLAMCHLQSTIGLKALQILARP